jgi:hypothetical protein
MFATIYLPNFFLQAAFRHQDQSSDTPSGVIDEQDKKTLLLQLNHAAIAAGVRLGMTPSQGLARCLHLLIKPRSAAQEQAVQDILLHYAFTLSPYIEDTGPGLCTIAFHHNRDLQEKVRQVLAQLAVGRISAQAGLGQTPDTSLLAAHLARPVLQINHPKDFLDPLPIETLAIGLES